MSLAARYGNSAGVMHRSRLIRHRSIRLRTPAALSAGSDTRDPAAGRACAEVCIHTAKLGREPADGITGGDRRALAALILARPRDRRPSVRIATANGLWSLGLNQQTVDPSATSSGIPPTRVAITGTPAAMLSSNA